MDPMYGLVDLGLVVRALSGDLVACASVIEQLELAVELASEKQLGVVH